MVNAKNSFGKVAVLMGGTSAERNISLLSGKAVLDALCSQGIDAHAFDPATRPLWEMKNEGFSLAFIALHGRFGEDGTVQGALETMGIRYTGSGVMASALAMDKWRTKMVWFAEGIPTPRYKMLSPQTDLCAVVEELGLPLVVKPVREGSSIGITKITSVAEFQKAFDLAYQLDPLVIAEEFITGEELTAAILGDQALPLVKIQVPDGDYDYEHKYFTDDVKYQCPAQIPERIAANIRHTALNAFKVLGCTGWGRADVIVRPDGRFSFLEMNTVPGMTGHSLVPMAARQSGIEFKQLCVKILEMANVE